MKKVIKNTLVLAACSALAFVSCKKDYHCQCAFNNQVVYTKDLGVRTQENATNVCNSYDSTITGETWQCVIY